MRTWGLGMSVGSFLLIGGASLLYLLSSLGEVTVQRHRGYALYADFINAEGIDTGSVVEIAGVPVGQIVAVQLVQPRSRVTLQIRDDVQVPEDAIASIQTKGLLGEQYLLITPGGSDTMIAPGVKIRETESPLDLPRLLAAFVSLRQKAAAKKTPPPP
jgi:phospholipid/cholesterol/gamma-HCH transport system substrate-binding protein